jgi:hypothetical protein
LLPPHSVVDVLKGLAARVHSLNSGLKWVGRDGLIICDDIGFGQLREEEAIPFLAAARQEIVLRKTGLIARMLWPIMV